MINDVAGTTVALYEPTTLHCNINIVCQEECGRNL